MERRENIGAVLRGDAPGRARAPGDLRARIDDAMGESGPGRERVPGAARKAPGAVAAAAVVLAGAAVWVGVGSPSAVEPEPDTPAAVAEGPERADPLSRFQGLALRSDPLTREAKQIWVEVNRFRATVERPVRTMADLGKSL